MVVSRLDSLLAVMRLPSERSARPVTPEIGARMRVYERFSSASLRRASAAAINAVDCLAVESAWSTSRCGMAFSLARGSSRVISTSANSFFTRSCCSDARACSTASS
jgi:hypothetical protein